MPRFAPTGAKLIKAKLIVMDKINYAQASFKDFENMV